MKTVAIIGRNRRLQDQIPWDTADEVWSMNNGYEGWRESRHFHRWLELHNRDWLLKHYGPESFHAHLLCLASLVKKGTAVLTWEAWEDIPSLAYPKSKVDALPAHRWHASSFDWAVSLAIVEGFRTISLHGVDLGPMDQGEPWAAFGAMSYWVGFAEARGIQVSVEGGSLFTVLQWKRSRHLQYGFDDCDNILEDESRVPVIVRDAHVG